MAERMTQYKWFWVWDFEKQERWLNGMAENGCVLAGVGWCRYTFEKCEPGEYTVRLEMCDRDENYISFMEETGAEYVGRFMRWHFFRKKSEYGQFDLFSDLDSRISHLRRIHQMLWMLGIINVGIGIVNLFMGVYSTGNAFVAAGNLLVATVLMYGVGRIKGKMEYLENERKLRE
ncbi:MAG: DUF2812 domain-containing protein [Lachnospiraceae bacterium]|nr:DUF2812 domain-containing protein [Lachnospiraceae bacterium]